MKNRFLGGWKKGLPKDLNLRDKLIEYEIYYTKLGVVWHRIKDELNKDTVPDID